mmetsp:Transcript_3631/g.6350  ORF Transcript_3631/g.6350 Transcript_3631/m.6350 type:complete len:216 (-) Transcript_3631:772-1419(-)|eukprot:CAMPEP_0182449530 /NCGR_PEP_ID=MMETSP1172-20130603/35097_1 /TAXON_ID=708627 /ORGANISM="Timspurckia oligopyrenoides, Strain CCMP3278" /LENGTH=215 /DNA_ID=CAMNT_0024646847 /DNA_START=256 /DNA_END=903 /DNA_ORIENTATION=-
MAFVSGVGGLLKSSTSSFTGDVAARCHEPVAHASIVMTGFPCGDADRRPRRNVQLRMVNPYGVVPRQRGLGFPSAMQLISDAEKMLTNPFEFFDALERDAAWTPRYGFDETNTEYILTIEAPGIPKEMVKLELKDDILTVIGGMQEEVKDAKEEKQPGTRREFFHARSFRRSMRLGPGVDREKIRASAKDGIITVKMPKLEEMMPKARLIEVEGE